MHALSCFDVDATGGLLALAQRYIVIFDAEDGYGFFSFNFDGRIVLRLPAYDGVN